jgi:hypothetical protein
MSSRGIRKKTSPVRPSSPLPKRNICGYPQVVDARDDPNILFLNEHTWSEQPKLIADFLRKSTTVPGDYVNYAGPAQGDAWHAIVQRDTNGKNCLGTHVYLMDSFDDEDFSDEDDDNARSEPISYISDSDTEGGRKTRKKKSKKFKKSKNSKKSKKSKNSKKSKKSKNSKKSKKSKNSKKSKKSKKNKN